MNRNGFTEHVCVKLFFSLIFMIIVNVVISSLVATADTANAKSIDCMKDLGDCEDECCRNSSICGPRTGRNQKHKTYEWVMACKAKCEKMFQTCKRKQAEKPASSSGQSNIRRNSCPDKPILDERWPRTPKPLLNRIYGRNSCEIFHALQKSPICLRFGGHGYTEAKFSYKSVTSADGTICKIILEAPVSVHLPQWVPAAGSSEVLKKQWKEFYDKLLRCEGEHVRIHRKYFEIMVKELDRFVGAKNTRSLDTTFYRIVAQHDKAQKEPDQAGRHTSVEDRRGLCQEMRGGRMSFSTT